MDSKPLKGLRVGLIRETIEDGVDPEVITSIRGAASHLEELGCTVTEVFFIFSVVMNLMLSYHILWRSLFEISC